MTRLERACLVAVMLLAIMIALADAQRLAQLHDIRLQLDQLAAAMADSESQLAMLAWRLDSANATLGHLYGGQIAVSDQIANDLIELRLALGLGLPPP